jgi:hypothetical protein
MITLFFAHALAAAQIVTYNCENTPAPTTTDPGVTAGNITLSTGTITYYSGSPGEAIASTNWTVANKYWQFQITPNAGNQVTLSSFTFKDQASSTGAQTWTAYVVDGANVTQIGSGSTHGSIGSGNNAVTISGAASGPYSGPYSIRLQGAGGSSANGTWRLDTWVLNGTVGSAGPNIAVTDPTAATTWTAGSASNNVAWTTQQITSGNVDIQVSTNGVAGPFINLASVAYDASPVQVNAPATQTATAIIRVSHAGLAVSGDSPVFSIIGPPPTVAAVYPPIGNAAGGASVTISGTNFAGTPTVTFGSTAATGVVVVNPTTITCNAPAGTANTRANVSVTVGAQTGMLANGFTYMSKRLSVGDVWVIGYRSDAADGFSFVPWVALNPGEFLAFTDKSFNGTSFFDTENLLVWQAPGTGLSAGAVVTVDCAAGPTASASAGTVLFGNLDDLSDAGDQVFVLQGNLAATDALFGLAFGAPAAPGWITGGTATSNDSYLPATLNVPGGNIDVAPTNTADNGEYNGARTGQDVGGYKALVSAGANWRFNDDGAVFGTLDGTAFNILLPNQAPVNSLPGPQATDEDVALVLGGATAIMIADPDAGANAIEVSLSVTTGVLTLARTTGITVTGGANASGQITIEGVLTDVNLSLDGLTFTPDADFNGTATLTVATSDLGNTGTGGPLTDTDNLVITVDAVNDAPVLTLPVAQSVTLGGTLSLTSGTGNGIRVDDVDAAAGQVEVTLDVAVGTLTVAAAGSAQVQGNASISLLITGTEANVNATLDTLQFDAPGSAQPVTLTVGVDDLGNSGAGGPLNDSGVVAIDVTALPAVGISVPSLDLTAALGSNSGPKSYSVTGTNLTGDIGVAASAPFTVALSGAGPFSANATLPPSGGMVFVRYSPTTGTTHTGQVTHTHAQVAPIPDVDLDGEVFTITTTSPLPQAMVGTAYNQPLAAVGGEGAKTWTITTGPTWLSISTAGVLSGTPVTSDVGVQSVTVLVADTQSPQQSVSATLSLTVAPVPIGPTSNNGDTSDNADGCASAGHGSRTAAALVILAMCLGGAGCAVRRRRSSGAPQRA